MQQVINYNTLGEVWKFRFAFYLNFAKLHVKYNINNIIKNSIISI